MEEANRPGESVSLFRLGKLYASPSLRRVREPATFEIDEVGDVTGKDLYIASVTLGSTP